MRRIPFGVGVLGVSMIVGACEAAAQSPVGSTGPVTIGIGGGFSVPTSNASDNFDTGFHGLGFLGLNLPGIPVGLRGTFTFNRFDLKPDGVPGADPDEGYEQILSGLANVVLPFPIGRVTPYLMAGVGAFNIKTVLDDADDDAESTTEFGINGGAGLMFSFSPKVGSFVEARVNNVYTSDEGVIEAEDIQFIPITFGLSYTP